MKKLTTFLLPLLALGLAGCTNNAVATSASGPSMTKHEVTLSMSNYQTYFDVTASSHTESMVGTFTKYIFMGCLNYAFYSNVVVTFDVTSSTASSTITLALNAGGNGTAGDYRTIAVSGISGMVSYWF